MTFDGTWGTDTLGSPWWHFGNYEPTPVDVVEAALDALPGPTSERSFVDLGSGKGRVVLLASRRGFRRVVGIEHRAKLHAVAERNRATFVERGGARCEIHLLCGDAAHHPLPEGPLVVWLFNPFGAEVLQPLLVRLAGRDVQLVYVVPVELPLVQAAGFREISRSPTTDGGEGEWPWVILGR